METSQTENRLDSYKDRVFKFSNELDLGLIVHIIKRNIWIVFLLFFICFSLAFIYLRYSQTVYQSSSVIQINDDQQTNQILKINNLESNTNKIAEAIEQMRSKIFLKKVIENSDVRITYYNEGTFKNNELYKSAPYLIKFNIKQKSIFGTKIYISFNSRNTGKLSFIANGKTNEILFNINNFINSPFFDLSISLKNDLDENQIKTLISGDNKSYFILKNTDDLTDELQSKLDIKLLNDAAKTILLTVKDYNSEKAKDLVNLVAEEYLQYDVDRKSESSKSILSFIDGQLKVVYDELKVSENDLQNFRKDKNYTDKEEIITSGLLRISNIEDQMLKIELQEKLLAELQSNINKNKSIDTYQLISLISGSEDEDAIKVYTNKIQQLLVEKENLLYVTTPNSENIKQINFNIETQKKLLIESINSVRLKYKSKYNSLVQKSSEFKQQTIKEPDEDMEYARLMRLFSISEKYYTILLERKTEFSISKAGFVSQNVILERALNNGTKVSPNTNTTILISVLSALLISILIIVIRYFLHNTISSFNDITKQLHTSISILGIVPKYESIIPVSQLVVDKNSKSHISEAFRTIRSNLNIINNKHGTKIIAITSSVSGEGKTFVSLNIAGILAYSGKKVILLDLDMRKPKIHKGFGVHNNIGTSTILNNTATVHECINKSHFPNLDYITAGPIPPNPSELILSDNLDIMIEELKKIYDYIIFDNPPIGLVTDGITTIHKADFPIYVFRADYSKKSFVQILDKLIFEGNVKNVGIILNSVDIKRSTYGYRFGYGYGYGYGYNYGNGYYED